MSHPPNQFNGLDNWNPIADIGFHQCSFNELKRLGPTSVALPWLRACSVKLQLLWMCSFPCRSEASWACRTCTQVSGDRSAGRRAERTEQLTLKQRAPQKKTFCLVLQMFSISVTRAVLRWCSARSTSSNVLVISTTACIFLSLSCREISVTSSMAAVSWGSLQGRDSLLQLLLQKIWTPTISKSFWATLLAAGPMIFELMHCIVCIWIYPYIKCSYNGNYYKTYNF